MAIHSPSGKRSASCEVDELPESKRKPTAPCAVAVRVHHAVAKRAPLLVSWVNLPEGWEDVARLAYRWSGEACDLKKNGCTPLEKERLVDSFEITLDICNARSEIFEHLSDYRVGVCMGGGKEQGVMVAKINRPQNKKGCDLPSVKIEFLATRPGNLCASGVEARFSGVGRSLIEHAESLAREEGISCLVVQSIGGAVDFYERCGFMPISHVWKKYDAYGLSGGNMATFVEPLTGI